MKYLFWFSVLLCACNSERHFNKLANEHPDWLKHKDSIITVTKIVPHDSLITIKGDYIYKDSLITIPCPDKVELRHNTGATTKITKAHDTVIITSRCDSLQARIVLLEKQILITDTKTVVVPPPPPSFFQSLYDGYKTFCIWLVSILLIIIAGYTGGRLLSLIPKIPGLPI